MTDLSREDFGFRRRWTISRWTPLAERTLEEMWLAGATDEEMSATLGVSITSIRSKARQIGLPKRTHTSAWPENDQKLLRQLWADGLTANNIGVILDKTRNAVLGMAYRLGLEKRTGREWRSGRPARLTEAKPPKPRRRSPPALWKLAAEPAKKPKEEPWAGSRNIALMDLQAGECRFPFGETPPFLFCGQPTLPGQPYCAHCYRVAHQKRTGV